MSFGRKLLRWIFGMEEGLMRDTLCRKTKISLNSLTSRRAKEQPTFHNVRCYIPDSTLRFMEPQVYASLPIYHSQRTRSRWSVSETKLKLYIFVAKSVGSFASLYIDALKLQVHSLFQYFRGNFRGNT